MKRSTVPELGPKSLLLEPIGVVRSPFVERVQAPRQPDAARGVEGTIELLPGKNFEHALLDIESFRYLWVVFWFHLNSGWRPKVLPPRSSRRRGVFATRSPHRPNPIGLSVVELLGVDGLSLRVANLDMLDGTPVLDIKPYVPYADSLESAEHGWLEKSRDPEPDFEVEFTDAAEAELAFLRQHFTVDLRSEIARLLALGPAPHPYRRIRRDGDRMKLALKEWRIRFEAEARRIRVLGIESGYRSREIALSDDPLLTPHREFVRVFGAPPRPPRAPRR